MNKLLLWLVFNVPLGKLAPYVLAIALGTKPQKKAKNEYE